MDYATALISVALMIVGMCGFISMERVPALFGEPLSPGSYPQALFIGLTISGLVLLADERRKGDRKGAVARLPEKERSPWRMFLLLTSFILYAALMRFLGYTISTFAFLLVASTMLSSGRQRATTLLAIAAFATLATYCIFRYVLRVFLPSGLFI